MDTDPLNQDRYSCGVLPTVELSRLLIVMTAQEPPQMNFFRNGNRTLEGDDFYSNLGFGIQLSM